MRTNAIATIAVVCHLDLGERFDHKIDTATGWETYTIEQVGYSGGHTSFVGRRTNASGYLAKRTRLINNIATRDVPEEIQTAIRGAVRAQVGEQAKALGIVR